MTNNSEQFLERLQKSIARLEKRLNPIDHHLQGFFISRHCQNQELDFLRTQIEQLQTEVSEIKKQHELQ